MLKKVLYMAIFVCLLPFAVHAVSVNSNIKQVKYSETLEKEKPELSEETKKIIAAYQKNPTQENRLALRERVEMSYDRILARKKGKLQELKKDSKNSLIIKELQQEVDEMVKNKKSRIERVLNRYRDEPLKSEVSQIQKDFVPLAGAPKKISIAYTPVTNEEYAMFVENTKAAAPMGWTGKKFPENKNDYPVTGVSYKDAVAYCEWLTKQDGKHKYRLPTEEEWELAAGPMPEDANINCGLNQGITPVHQFSETVSASGAIDMWGNVWEWTSTSKATVRGILLMNVKGGSWATSLVKCRTEYRGDAREPRFSDTTLGFRLIRED